MPTTAASVAHSRRSANTMKRECIVSCLVQVDAGDTQNEAIIEAMAKHEFLSRVHELTPDSLTIEILEEEQ